MGDAFLLGSFDYSFGNLLLISRQRIYNVPTHSKLSPLNSKK
jgi:hypothetical protein